MVDEVAEHVDVAAVRDRESSTRGTTVSAGPCGGLQRLGDALDGVVVGDGEDVEPASSASATSCGGVSVPSEAVECT